MKKIIAKAKSMQALHFLSILIGFTEALVIYTVSSYFKEFSGREAVGIFYVGAYLMFLLTLFNYHKLVKTFGKTMMFKSVLVFQLFVTLILIFSPFAWLKLVAMMLYLLCENLLLVNLDIVIESFSTGHNSGRMRGSHLTILNLGFILGPMLSAWLLSYGGYILIFAIALILKTGLLGILWFKLGDIANKFRERVTVGQLIKKALANQDIRRIYYISFILETFYALMIMYSPIYLRALGVSWADIGIIFTVMLVPFLFFEYPIGWLADKELGEKEMIIFFLSWMALSVAWVYKLDQPDVFKWSLALLATRIGASAIQILRDSYFYKKIDKDDVDLIDFYRTAMPMAYIISAGLSALIVSYFGVREIFLLAAVLLITALVPAWRLRDNLSEREILLERNSKLEIA
ncbi:MAG: MFS transporter [bacterium]